MAGEDDKKKGKSFFKNPFRKKSKEIQDEPVFTGSNPLYEGNKPDEVGTGYSDAAGYSDAEKLNQGQETPITSQRSSRSSSAGAEVDASELPSPPSDNAQQKPSRGELRRSPRETDLSAASKTTSVEKQTENRTIPHATYGSVSEAQADNSERASSSTPYGNLSQIPTFVPAAQTRGSGTQAAAREAAKAALQQARAEKIRSNYTSLPPEEDVGQAAKQTSPRPLPSTEKLAAAKAARKAPHEQQYGMIPGEMKPKPGSFKEQEDAKRAASAKNKGSKEI